MIYKPKYFQPYELLPEEFYEEQKHHGDKLWLIFDHRLLVTLDRLRGKYGRATLNDWYWGGGNHARGWRPFNSKVGSFFSQHKFGRAADPKFKDATAEEIREDLRKMKRYPLEFKHIQRVEEGVDWFHFDLGHNSGEEARFFQP